MSEYILETVDLGISFGGLKAVSNVNLKIRKNEIYGIIGPNGAGKTTLFNMLTGVYKPTCGTFLLNGEQIAGLSEIAISRKGIARTFQNIRLFSNMSAIKNVMVGLHNTPEFFCSPITDILRLPRHFTVEKRMRKRALQLLSIFDLQQSQNTPAGELSYGEQRRLEIARALATLPKLLLLDEPAAGMNPQETADLSKTIIDVRDKFDMTVLLIEHDMSLVTGICDRVTVLNFGTTLAEGKVADALADPEVIRAYLGDE